MTLATDQSKSKAEAKTEHLLRMYRRIVMIREFEEQVNELYTRALMPGLPHLYIGEEGVAMGICEALRVDDYITSTHWGHGHCVANCHVTIAKDRPSIRKLSEYAKSKQAVPWVRVYTVLPGVAWNHRVHLEAGVKCETCHGQVREMEAMSEVTSVTTMYSCLHCHEMNQAKTACDTCHKR